MSQPIMSDIEGLTKVVPFSRRGFMTAAGAAAAGYTLAAGPVRADAIHTSAEGLNAGMSKVAVRAATCRFISPSPKV